MIFFNLTFIIMLQYFNAETSALSEKNVMKRDTGSDLVIHNGHYTDIHDAAMWGKLDYLVGINHHQANIRGPNDDTTLHLAAAKGELETVKYFIENGANINAVNSFNNTSFHDAVLEGKLDTMKYFIKNQNKSVNLKGQNGNTPLHMAAIDGDIELVTYLLNNGAQYNIINNKGNTAIQEAIMFDKLDVLDCFMKSLNPIQQTSLLHYATIHGKLEEVRYLLRDGINPYASNAKNFTALHEAAFAGQLNVVSYFLEEKNIDVNIKGIHGWTPLFRATEGDRLNVLKYLIRKGGNIDMIDDDGNKILHVAAKENKKDIMQYLIDSKKSDINQKGQHGNTPLNMAALKGQVSTVQCLLDKGADRSIENNDGMRPFESAIIQGHLNVVRFLAEGRNFDIDFRSPKGHTPLTLATIHGHLNIVTFLVEKGANIISSGANNTILHEAAKHGKANILEFLIDNKKFNINQKGEEGYNPLLFATKNNDLNAVKLLVVKGADINILADDKNNALHEAAGEGLLDILKYLIETKKAHIDIKGPNGCTPLLIATTNIRVDVIKYLVEKGANINLAGDNNNTPVHEVSRHNGRLHILQILVESKRADINLKGLWNYTPLCWAACRNDLNTLKYLEAKGTNYFIACTNLRNTFASSIALLCGSLDVLKYYVEVKKLDMNDGGGNCNTPLIWSAIYHRLETIKYLVEKGANIKKCFSETFIFLAVKKGHPEIFKFLYENNIININKKDNDWRTILHLAAEVEKLDMVKYLIDAGLCDRDVYKNTPFHFAARAGQLGVIKFLVEHKSADINIIGEDGYTPLHWAAYMGHLDIVKYLIANGANFNLVDNFGHTLLHEAAFAGRLNVVKYLVEDVKISVNVQAMNKDTPLNRAMEKVQVDTIRYLLNKGVRLNKGVSVNY